MLGRKAERQRRDTRETIKHDAPASRVAAKVTSPPRKRWVRFDKHQSARGATLTENIFRIEFHTVFAQQLQKLGFKIPFRMVSLLVLDTPHNGGHQ
ncbi:MAG: hypothetical protein JWO20_1727 [Candidatus Angelobacter sp.]|jgi:hypothetical protein|nr:hypothetical protein [Candidatus Angelobacter sp.]